MSALFWLLHTVIQLYIYVLFAAVIYSLLASFNVLDTRNRIVWSIGDFLYRLTEPALRRIRRFLPDLGAVDISPMILILLLYFAQRLLVSLELELYRSGVF